MSPSAQNNTAVQTSNANNRPTNALLDGDYYFKNANYQKAIECYKAAHQNERKSQPNKAILQRLVESSIEIGDYKSAYNYQEKLIAMEEETQKEKLYKYVATQLTDFEQLEELKRETQARTKHLTEQQHRVSEFASIVAKDLNRPVDEIHKLYQQLKSGLQTLQHNEADFLNFIGSGVENMSQLLDSLLQYVTLESGNDSFEMVSTNSCIAHALKNLNYKMSGLDIQIKMEKLPKLFANRTLLTQLFQNLLDNCIKFRKPNETLLIEIKASEDITGRPTISISDNGIGIHTDYQKKIFKIFQRIDKINHQGTGIGLAICNKIVYMHSGVIWVDSEEGKGCTFSVRF